MRISFPHMSPVIVYKKLLEMLGHEVIVPPKPTQKTFDLGVKHSPEFACFPLKVILGSYIESIEMGAEAIITSGGHGPCRAGYYGELHDRILKNLGYKCDIIVIDAIFPHFWDFTKKALKIANGTSIFKIVKTLKVVYKLSYAIDRVEKRIEKMRAYEINEGDCERAWNKILKVFDKTKTITEIEEAGKEANRMLDGVPVIQVEESNKIRIGIIGEIYVVLESSVNMEIEKILGTLGVETERSQYLSDWIEHNIIPGFIRDKKIESIIEQGEEFIEIEIGGHAQENVGYIKHFKEMGFDGIIHLMPFGCLPELVNQSIIPNIIERFDLPVLTIPIDEQTGKANNQTRIEAFVDLLRGKKQQKICK
ncbi:2-hydroxyacyl-CoA dehydratase [Pseudobacteroides cellulosolvens]|uniref:2-hydroxyglutaryl-CoA dehydratase D-component n=1 Tax=Pseudobacteroides cellulosolvens ATCC 35603 = DSM 2933 TaxID=398512 RepID=A0A0L6JQN8_9FIRM|nr:2-hydroxyacyl-CoA dehydratase [Pseudobacteroides cellulosolvens]KNY28104.1 2-hydroxyglutaryl-CoA dehydratase D-component [Pseudobacteroides cellulosolvens ATCC 35603 = DSM 2933]